MQRLKIPREQRATVKRLLQGLVEAGHLVQTRGNRFGLPDRMNLVVGRVQTHPRGFGFVIPDRPVEGVTGDIFIAGGNLNQAMHGDRVVARIERSRGDRAEGRIVRILERGSSSIVGRFEVDESGTGFLVPFDRRLIMDVMIPDEERQDAKPGDMVVVEITRWPTPTRSAARPRRSRCSATSRSRASTPRSSSASTASPTCTARRRSRRRTRLGGAVKEKDIRGRTDFRRVTTVTIDGEHARDFDDAITIEKLPNGNYWLGVHIADVAHYVPEGGALDEEAYERSTSVYFPERAVHMFPSELSTGLCSLNPNVDRLVQSCLMEIDRRGDVVRYEIHDGVIHSDARMTYTDVNAILTDRDPGADEEVRDARADVRDDARAVPDPERPPQAPRLDRLRPQGAGDHPRRRGDGRADHRRSSATSRTGSSRSSCWSPTRRWPQHLDQNNVPTLYRIHEEPDPLKVEQFEEFISTIGYSLGAPSNAVRPRHFQRLVEKIHGKPEEKPIAFLMLRTMQKARYDPQNLGHFGLAASSYTHFTSPIRRYPDLVVHRTLRESRQRDGGRAHRGADRGSARDGAAHLRARAARQRRRARARAVEEGPLHGRQGRRRVRGLHHRRHRVRPVHRADRALRRRHGPRVDHGRRLLPLHRASSTCCAARTPAASTASATACACR